MSAQAALLPQLCDGADAMELRVDLLAERDDPIAVLRQLQLLRASTARRPVIFTVRSKGQCGAFPDDADAIFELARQAIGGWGLRGGVEYLDIEANWPMEHRAALIAEARRHYPATALIGSYHVMGRATSEERAKELFLECYHNGAVDAVKVVTTAMVPEDGFRVHHAAQALRLPVPYIGLCLTATGQLSRVLNRRFTPVTHGRLPAMAAPGQMTAEHIMKLRKELAIVPPRRFFLFGSPIAASPRPDMQPAG
ncbi:unnamed protein product, partial [Phaeothamnion confervicola]